MIAPLLPGVELDYEATVGTGVRDPAGQALAQPHRWNFRTRRSRAVVIPTEGDDGEQTSLALDEGGGVHASHVGGGNVVYSTCASRCTDAAGWQSAVIDRGGRSSSLRVDPTGQRHLAYYGGLDELRYAVCPALCDQPAGWTAITVDPAVAGGSRVSLVLDAGGGLHLAYYDETRRFRKYAACSADCTSPGSWWLNVPDETGDYGRASSLGIDAAGRLHLASHEASNGELRYSTCQSDCTGDGWQTTTIDATDDAGASTALAVGGDGRLHVVYHADDTDDLRYATCAGACGSAATWQTTILDAVPDAGEFVAIALDRYGRPYLTYWHSSGGVESLRFATCATDCADAASWQRTTMDGSGRVGRYSALAVDPLGRVHATYYDQDRRDLKYVE
ncbi:MAG: Ig-like domain-containing protein [Gemmatimonadales bacterium]